MSIEIYESNGSDGYTAGTWGCIVRGTDDAGTSWTSSDGGFPDREMAEERGKKLAEQST